MAKCYWREPGRPTWWMRVGLFVHAGLDKWSLPAMQPISVESARICKLVVV
jgi:hypothetical protein